MHQANGLEIQINYVSVFEIIFMISYCNAEISASWALETKQIVGKHWIYFIV